MSLGAYQAGYAWTQLALLREPATLADIEDKPEFQPVDEWRQSFAAELDQSGQ